jgi:hypothetical protein
MKQLLFKIRNFFVPYPKYRIAEKIVNRTIEIGERHLINTDLHYENTSKTVFVVQEKSKKGFYFDENSFHTFRGAKSYIDAKIKEGSEIVWIYYNV